MKTVYIDINGELTTRKTRKIAKKLYKMNKKEEIVVALSKDLAKNEELNNQISDFGIEVLNGRWLFKFLLCEIIEYVSNIEHKREELQIIAILMEKQDDIVLAQLLEIARKVKTLKIISEFAFGLNFLEQKLYNDYGIAIQITNNRRKALANANIVINFDYTEEKLSEYNINPQAILINIQEKVENFIGTNIIDYKIEYNKENFDNMTNELNFDSNIIYESYIYRKDTLQNIRSQLSKDNVRLTALIQVNKKYYFKKAIDKQKILA